MTREDTTLRELRDEDAEAVAALFFEAFGEARAMDAEEIRSWIRNEELKPEMTRVLELGGRVVGYADASLQGELLEVDVAAPGHWETFLEWGEDLARAGGQKRIDAQCTPKHEMATVLEQRGYRQWKTSYRMEIPLADPEPATFPDGIELRKYRPEVDEETVRATINDVFSGDAFFHPVSIGAFREFHLKARGYDPDLWLLAWDGEDLAGIAITFPERSGDTNLGWVSELGVSSLWRRRGLGEALLRQAFYELHTHGLPRVGLGVDVENPTGALRLYERVGMSPVAAWDHWMLEL